MLLAGLFLAGCSPKAHNVGTGSLGGTQPSKTSATGAGGGLGQAIAVGAGPQKTYTVQQQQPPVGSCHYRYEGGEPLPDSGLDPESWTRAMRLGSG